jgi:hypothetical protein
MYSFHSLNTNKWKMLLHTITDLWRSRINLVMVCNSCICMAAWWQTSIPDILYRTAPWQPSRLSPLQNGYWTNRKHLCSGTAFFIYMYCKGAVTQCDFLSNFLIVLHLRHRLMKWQSVYTVWLSVRLWGDFLFLLPFSQYNSHQTEGWK